MLKMAEVCNESSILSHVENSEQTLSLGDLSKFHFKGILSDSVDTKTVIVEGRFNGDDKLAILILEKESFEKEKLQQLFKQENLTEKIFKNDIYHIYRYFPKSDFNGIKASLIYPATEKHLLKYEYQPIHIIEETPELYESVTLPFLRSEQFSLQWVFNILEHKSETDRIVYEDSNPENGFILCSDFKWDGKTVENLHLLAIPFKRGIKSLRDLTNKDLALLKNIYEKGTKAIEDKYSLQHSQLRIYVHYQPSFYHLHVHFTNLQYLAPGSGAERAHLLSNVINNLELISSYYQISKLDFVLKESDNLFGKFESLGLVKRLPQKG